MKDADAENRNDNKYLLDINVEDDGYGFACLAVSALSEAERELLDLNEVISETDISIKNLTPDCDKIDYVLAVSSGALCGIIDIFLVAKPGDSPLGEITDKWFSEKTQLFAKMFGWKDKGGDSLNSAIRFLEKKFKIPYDQTHLSESGKEFLGLTPKNHHFKSLAHNPSLLGLFYSILDQFNNTSHFVSNGELVIHKGSDNSFELRGHSIPAKFFCAFVNWFGHILSDGSGSSGIQGRGMGIPSPLWTWINDVIVMKDKLHLKPTEFEKSFSEFVVKLYENGYDTRFQATQAIPVFINEMIVRIIYSIRRMIHYLRNNTSEDRSFPDMWKSCEPFSNVTVKRMLTVAHGTFCLIDVGEAVAQGFAKGGGYFNVMEFVMRLNIPGLGRFGVSLYGEANRGRKCYILKEEERFLKRKKDIINDYIEGLRVISEAYDDGNIVDFIDAFEMSDVYITAFNDSVKLAEKRGVPRERVLKDKNDIDNYFRGRSK